MVQRIDDSSRRNASVVAADEEESKLLEDGTCRRATRASQELPPPPVASCCVATTITLFFCCLAYYALAEVYPESFLHPKHMARKGGAFLQDQAMKYSSLLSSTKPSQGETDAGALRLVLVLQAQGDTTPAEKFSYETFQYEEGLGQLTTRGMLQMMERGASVRSRYISRSGVHGGLVPEEWGGPRSDELYVRTIMEDAALDSANSYLLGLYPPLDTGGFVFGQEKKARRKLELGIDANCTCRPQKPKKQLLKHGNGFTEFNTRAASKGCLAQCLGLGYGGKALIETGMQDVAVEAPLGTDKDWLLLQDRICKVPLEEVRMDEDQDEGFYEQQSRNAALLKDLRKLAGCKERDQTQTYAKNCQLCRTGLVGGKAKKRCEVLKIQDIPQILDNIEAAKLNGFSTEMPRWFPAENWLQSMRDIKQWIWHRRYKPEVVGKQVGGLLLGDVVRRLEAAYDGEKKERLVVYIAPMETITNFLIVLGLRNPVPPSDLEEIVIELRERTPEQVEKTRETKDGWSNVLAGSEGLWMVRVLRNNSPVEMKGCIHGHCSLPTIRTAWADRLLDPDGSEAKIKEACLESQMPKASAEESSGVIVGTLGR